MIEPLPSLDTLTVDFLNHVMIENGIDAEITNFTTERIGTGQVGQCHRISLDYNAKADSSAPQTLIGKWPSDDKNSRETGVWLGNYLKEVRFYQRLYRQLDIRTPHCYFADIEDEQRAESLLLLEDMAPAQQGDQLLGCSPEIAESAVLELVGLHGPTWNHQDLCAQPWLNDTSAERVELGRSLYAQNLQPFLDRYGDAFSKDEKEVIAAVPRYQNQLSAALPQPYSAIHIDYRLDNLLIANDTQQVTAVDWQSVTLGAPMNDVAYFLGGGMLREQRQAHDQKIVRNYYDRLIEVYNIQDYAWDDCWNGYRFGVFSGIIVAVIAAILVERTERGDEMFIAMAKRAAEQAIDNNSLEFT